MNQVIGAHIDRRRNQDARKFDLNFFLKNNKLFKIYVPKNIREKTLPMNVEMVVKFTTNFKLNITDPEGNSLIPADDYADNEIHFVRFESVFNEVSSRNLYPSILRVWIMLNTKLTPKSNISQL